MAAFAERLTATGVRWGIFLILPAEVAALLGGVSSAWVFLTSIPSVPQR